MKILKAPTRRRLKKRKWSNDEVDELKTLAGKYGLSYIATKMKLSRYSVAKKLKRIGLRHAGSFKRKGSTSYWSNILKIHKSQFAYHIERNGLPAKEVFVGKKKVYIISQEDMMSYIKNTMWWITLHRKINEIEDPMMRHIILQAKRKWKTTWIEKSDLMGIIGRSNAGLMDLIRNLGFPDQYTFDELKLGTWFKKRDVILWIKTHERLSNSLEKTYNWNNRILFPSNSIELIEREL